MYSPSRQKGLLRKIELINIDNLLFLYFFVIIIQIILVKILIYITNADKHCLLLLINYFKFLRFLI